MCYKLLLHFPLNSHVFFLLFVIVLEQPEKSPYRDIFHYIKVLLYIVNARYLLLYVFCPVMATWLSLEFGINLFNIPLIVSNYSTYI